ncbi:Uncharacterised protein [Mycobacteroides abscessus subsp. abscessus]|nr:Uncharacterised protein [Mycobacteroides abscessus subsp. abscessus]
MRITVAESPTVTSMRVVSGPMWQWPPITVAECSWVPGAMVASWPIWTSTSIQVLDGSMMVTPLR